MWCHGLYDVTCMGSSMGHGCKRFPNVSVSHRRRRNASGKSRASPNRTKSAMIATTCRVHLSNAYHPKNTEDALVTNLLRDYNPDVRPLQDSSEAVTLDLSFLIEYIENLDEREQVLKTWMIMFTTWRDEFMLWEPSDYNGTKHTMLIRDKLWTPDLYFANGVDTFLDEPPSSYMLSWVQHNGTVTQMDRGLARTRCWIDIRYFPFDTQVCDISVELFSSIAPLVYLRSVEVDMLTDDVHAAWRLVKETHRVYNRTQGPFSRATITLTLSRKPLVYAFSLVVPILALSLLALLPFCLPAESGEKVALCITVLLSFTVFQTMLFNILPDASSNLPVIALHNSAAFLISGLTMTATTFVLRVTHKTGPVPARIQRWLKLGPPSSPCGLRCPFRYGGVNSDDPTKAHQCPSTCTTWPQVAKRMDKIFAWLSIGTNCLLLIITTGVYGAHMGT